MSRVGVLGPTCLVLLSACADKDGAASTDTSAGMTSDQGQTTSGSSGGTLTSGETSASGAPMPGSCAGVTLPTGDPPEFPHAYVDGSDTIFIASSDFGCGRPPIYVADCHEWPGEEWYAELVFSGGVREGVFDVVEEGPGVEVRQTWCAEKGGAAASGTLGTVEIYSASEECVAGFADVWDEIGELSVGTFLARRCSE